MRRAVHGDTHPNIAGSLDALAKLMMRAGRLDDAESLIMEALAITRQALGDRHLMYGGLLSHLGELRMAQGDLVAADSLTARGLELRGTLSGRTGGPYALALRVHALVKVRQRRFEEAEQMLLHALGLLRVQVVPGGRDQREIHDALAQLYTAWGRRDDAARHRALAEPVPIHT
jgi:tetratricopeptide (TPR) repeat protein